MWQNNSKNWVNLHFFFGERVFICTINAAGGPYGVNRGS